MTEPVKIHVRTAVDNHQGLILDLLGGNIFFHAGDGKCTGRLHDRARIVENVLDGGTDFVSRHANNIIHALPGNTEGLPPDLLHGYAIGEDANVIKYHAPLLF